MQNQQIKSRIFYLDYLRLFVILLVVLVHSMIAYSQFCPDWWYVVNSNQHLNMIFDFFILIVDRFLMPLLFFVAGYFALSSIIKSELIIFLKKKFYRIFLPLVLGIIFINPISMYISNVSNHSIYISFFEFWIGSYLTFGFQLYHLWFLLILFIFILAFAIVYKFNKKLFEIDYKNKKTISKFYLFLFIIILSFFSFLINFECHDLSWFFLGMVRIFQPTRIIFYIFFFYLGIYSYKKGILSFDYRKKDFLFWFYLSLVFLVIIGVYYYFYYSELTKNLIFQLISIQLLWLFCLSAIFTTILFFKRYLNKENKLLSNFSKNSYGIYIIHYPIVTIFQYFLLDIDVSIYLKLIVVFVPSILFSWLFSNIILTIKSFIFDSLLK